MPADAVLTTQAYRANETGKRTEPFAEVYGWNNKYEHMIIEFQTLPGLEFWLIHEG